MLFLSCKNEVNTNDNSNSNETTSPERKSSTAFVYSGNSVYSKYFDNNIDQEAAYYSTKANISDRDIVGIRSCQ